MEIVRGPFSSLYGANAFGGVINIITQTGDGLPSLQVSAETTFYKCTQLHEKTVLMEGSSG